MVEEELSDNNVCYLGDRIIVLSEFTLPNINAQTKAVENVVFDTEVVITTNKIVNIALAYGHAYMFGNARDGQSVDFSRYTIEYRGMV